MIEITAENLHLWRGDVHVLRGVSFVLRGGECLQISGDNGSGKTTLLRALVGLVPLEEGRICWCGAPIGIDPAAYHAELAYLGHENGLKGDLTAAENLRYGIGLRRHLGADEIAAALARTGLGAHTHSPLRQLSAGQRRRVALARLSLSAAGLWILDEPSSNLDAAGQGLLLELLQAHLLSGGAAAVASHQPLGLRAEQVRSLVLP